MVDLATFSKFDFVANAASVRRWTPATIDADAGSAGHKSPNLELLTFPDRLAKFPDTIETNSIGYRGTTTNDGSVSHVLGLTAMGSAEDLRAHGRLVREWML